jgi:stage III sporulation protein AF
MDAVMQYVLRLVMLTLLFSVLEILMPSGAMRRFGALAIGVVLLACAVAPVIGWLGSGDAEFFSLDAEQWRQRYTDTGINRSMTPYE